MKDRDRILLLNARGGRFARNTLIVFSLTIFFIFGGVLNFPVAAQTPKDCSAAKLRDQGVVFLDCSGSSSTCSPAQSTPLGTATAGGRLYMIGDSITQGSQAELEQAFTTAGYTATVNGLSSRRLSEGSTSLDGQTVLAADMEEQTNKDASVVVVALGTNHGLSTDSINTALTTIKAAATNAKVFWVNVGVDNEKRDSADLTHAVGDNEAIAQQSASGALSLVDWAAVVAQHPEYIAEDGLGVHPNTEGRTAFAQTIVAALSGSTSSSSSGCGGNVICSPSDDTDTRAKQVWDFFIGKGLRPEAAAGFLGNMAHEAHFESRLVEYGWQNSRGEISKAGDNTSLDDELPPTQYRLKPISENKTPTMADPDGSAPGDDANSRQYQLGGGYGLIQFTSHGRKQHLQQTADRMNNAIPGDICVQLETVWEELNGDYKSSTLDKVMASTDVGAISDIIATKYEVHGGGSSENAERRASSADYFVKFGSMAATAE